MPPNKILIFFAQYIERELGIVYEEHNYFQLQNRLEEIAKLLGLINSEACYEQAQNGINGAFKQLLLDVATNNETSFFRDYKVFKSLESQLLKPFADKNESSVLSIWSAASSTGQEALSLAILIEEWSEKNNFKINYSILGTDISERALSKARTYKYSQLEMQRGMPAPLLIKYFKKDEEDNWTACERITKNIQYKNLNLKSQFVNENLFQIILCRNMLIYQRLESKAQIINRLENSLTLEGLLVLGSGESLIGISNNYHQILIDGAILYKKKFNFNVAA
jgi:chemotaxis protein methyltransferase CheR